MVSVKMASVVINAGDLDGVADFWKGFLEVGERQRFPGFVFLERQPGSTITVAVQEVENPTEGRNRLHLDFGTADPEAVRERVLELGGAELEQHEIGGFHWTVYGDPEGNEFCVAQADPDDHT